MGYETAVNQGPSDRVFLERVLPSFIVRLGVRYLMPGISGQGEGEGRLYHGGRDDDTYDMLT